MSRENFRKFLAWCEEDQSQAAKMELEGEMLLTRVVEIANAADYECTVDEIAEGMKTPMGRLEVEDFDSTAAKLGLAIKYRVRKGRKWERGFG